MKLFKTAAVSALVLALGSAAAVARGNDWAGLRLADAGKSGATDTARAWPDEPKWQGPGPMPRHHVAIAWGIPAPYDTMTNPLPQRRATVERGEAIYKAHCAACHGKDGSGNGEAGARLNPPPGNLVWLSDVPEKQWDAFMFWTIAEGGAQLGTAMPGYKEVLEPDDIWAVTAYIQANLPFVSHFR